MSAHQPETDLGVIRAYHELARLVREQCDAGAAEEILSGVRQIMAALLVDGSRATVGHMMTASTRIDAALIAPRPIRFALKRDQDAREFLRQEIDARESILHPHDRMDPGELMQVRAIFPTFCTVGLGATVEDTDPARA